MPTASATFTIFIALAASCPSLASPAAPLDDLWDLSRLARLRTGVKTRMFSSYDRKGGNDDGFNGTYSKLRVEEGRSVIAEMKGPGVIQRIWFTHSEYKVPGLLERKGERLRIWLDGKPEPAIDVPLEDIFSGKLPRFPAPLVGARSGGFYCYVPIPFRDGCKVAVDGTAVRFYHLTWSELPSADGVETFRMEPGAEDIERLAKAVRAWSEPGNLEAAEALPIQESSRPG